MLEEEATQKKMWREAEGGEKKVSFRISLRHKAVFLPFPGGLEHFCCFNQLWTAKIKQKNPQVFSWKFPHTQNRKLTLGFKLYMEFEKTEEDPLATKCFFRKLLKNKENIKAFTSNTYNQRGNH